MTFQRFIFNIKSEFKAFDQLFIPVILSNPEMGGPWAVQHPQFLIENYPIFDAIFSKPLSWSILIINTQQTPFSFVELTELSVPWWESLSIRVINIYLSVISGTYRSHLILYKSTHKYSVPELFKTWEKPVFASHELIPRYPFPQASCP